MTSDVPRRDSTNWANYYANTANRAPRRHLFDALERLPVGDAIDLGCGAGVETLALLSRGWSVLAIDRESSAIEYVAGKVDAQQALRLRTRVAAFEGLELAPGVADLVYAGYSLPFCRPESFYAVWRQIELTLRDGGVFVGDLFGVRDSWSGNGEMTFHSIDEVERLVLPFDAQVNEVEEDGRAVSGPKHWHRFEIAATKKVPAAS